MTRLLLSRRAALLTILAAPAPAAAREWLLQSGRYRELPAPGSHDDPQGYYDHSEDDRAAGGVDLIDPGPKNDAMALARRAPIARRTIPWAGHETPGTIIVSTHDRRLRLVLLLQVAQVGVVASRPEGHADGRENLLARCVGREVLGGPELARVDRTSKTAVGADDEHRHAHPTTRGVKPDRPWQRIG